SLPAPSEFTNINEQSLHFSPLLLMTQEKLLIMLRDKLEDFCKEELKKDLRQ
ncbi:hypothetical protein M9458_032849, partial [Cirrhinus mrigala]